MVVVSSQTQKRRLSNDAGIAIGPILFIIAVLGILAAAIAAGSGSFTTSTTGESNRAKAAATIDIGQNLKIGFDRIIGSSIEFANVNIDPTSVENVDDLFSPLGGGISPPSVTMSRDPATNVWAYPLVSIPRICTAAGGCRLAVIEVAEAVCTEINVRAAALAATPAAIAIDDLIDPAVTTLIDGATWPVALQGKPTGCIEVQADATMPAGFYFYQVIGIQ